MDPRNRADPDGRRRGQHAGGHRHADSRHRQCAERHQPGRRRHREDQLHLADAGGRAALRRRLRHDRRPEPGVPRRRGTLLRPSGREHRVLDPGQPADRHSADLRNGQLDDRSAGGLSPGAVPQLVTFQYDAKIPASWQWQAGVQMALPWASSLDVSYVGNHGVQPPGRLPGRQRRQPERGGLRRGVPAAEPGPDDSRTERDARRERLHARTCSGRTGARRHQPEHDGVLGHRTTRSRRRSPPVPERVLVRRQLHPGLSLDGNTGLQQRLQHAADGTVSVRSDQAQYEELIKPAEPPAAPPEAERRVGPARHEFVGRGRRQDGGRPHRQRLAAVGDLHRQLRQPVRPRATASRPTART